MGCGRVGASLARALQRGGHDAAVIDQDEAYRKAVDKGGMTTLLTPFGFKVPKADGAGAHAVIAPKDRAATLNEAAIQTASGAAESVPYITVTNLARTLRELRDRGIWLVGTADDADTGLHEAHLPQAVGMVLGAEGQGMRRLTREHCDLLVRIPMAGQVASLNVAVAAGVVLYEAVRQRRGSQTNAAP